MSKLASLRSDAQSEAPQELQLTGHPSPPSPPKRIDPSWKGQHPSPNLTHVAYFYLSYCQVHTKRPDTISLFWGWAELARPLEPGTPTRVLKYLPMTHPWEEKFPTSIQFLFFLLGEGTSLFAQYLRAQSPSSECPIPRNKSNTSLRVAI